MKTFSAKPHFRLTQKSFNFATNKQKSSNQIKNFLENLDIQSSSSTALKCNSQSTTGSTSNQHKLQAETTCRPSKGRRRIPDVDLK